MIIDFGGLSFCSKELFEEEGEKDDRIMSKLTHKLNTKDDFSQVISGHHFSAHQPVHR